MPKHIISAVLFVLVTIASIFFLRNILDGTEINLFDKVNFLFDKATSQDYDRRIKGISYCYVHDKVSHDWPQKEIVWETEQGIRVQTNIDSIRQLSEIDKLRIVNETILTKENPINPDSLNACFQQILQERGISASTGIRYTEVENNKTLYSGTDTAFFATAYPLKEHKAGIFDEIVVQAYVKIPFTTLVDRAGARVIIPFAVWLGLLTLYIVYICLSVRKRRMPVAEIKECITEAERLKGLLRLDTDKNCLYYKDQEIMLTAIQAQLVALFLSKPDLFVTKDEIADELWKGLDNSSNRLTQTVNRLRTTLDATPDLQIETMRLSGYRLVVYAAN